MQKTTRKRLSSRRKDRGRKEEISGSETLTRRYCTDDRTSRSFERIINSVQRLEGLEVVENVDLDKRVTPVRKKKGTDTVSLISAQ